MTDSATKYWFIAHGPDLTETGYLMKRTYLKTIWIGLPAHQACEFETVCDWCRDRFGKEVAYVQGVAPTLAWSVAPSDPTEFETAEPVECGGHNMETHQITMTIGNGRQMTIVSERFTK